MASRAVQYINAPYIYRLLFVVDCNRILQIVGIHTKSSANGNCHILRLHVLGRYHNDGNQGTFGDPRNRYCIGDNPRTTEIDSFYWNSATYSLLSLGKNIRILILPYNMVPWKSGVRCFAVFFIYLFFEERRLVLHRPTWLWSTILQENGKYWRPNKSVINRRSPRTKYTWSVDVLL